MAGDLLRIGGRQKSLPSPLSWAMRRSLACRAIHSQPFSLPAGRIHFHSSPAVSVCSSRNHMSQHCHSSVFAMLSLGVKRSGVRGCSYNPGRIGQNVIVRKSSKFTYSSGVIGLVPFPHPPSSACPALRPIPMVANSPAVRGRVLRFCMLRASFAMCPCVHWGGRRFPDVCTLSCSLLPGCLRSGALALSSVKEGVGPSRFSS